MINFAAGVTDIINDPMSHGIGSGIKLNSTKDVYKTWKKSNVIVQGKMSKSKNLAKSILDSKPAKSDADAAKKAANDIVKQQVKTSAQKVNEETIGELMRELLGKGSKGITLNGLVDMTMKKSVDSMLQDEIKKGHISLKTSSMGTTYATAKAYYKKLYDGGIIMTNIRNKAEKNISQAINKSINDRLFSWQNKLPGWGKNVLAKSKLASSLNKYITQQTKSCIEAIFGDSVLKNWNESLIKSLEKLKTSLKDQLQKSFKGGIDYYKKLRQAIADKIKVYLEMKKKFEQHITQIVNEYKKKISEAVQSYAKRLVSSIGDSVKSSIAGLKIS